MENYSIQVMLNTIFLFKSGQHDHAGFGEQGVQRDGAHRQNEATTAHMADVESFHKAPSGRHVSDAFSYCIVMSLFITFSVQYSSLCHAFSCCVVVVVVYQIANGYTEYIL